MVHNEEKSSLMLNETTEEPTTCVCTVESQDTLPPTATQTPTKDEVTFHSEVRLQIPTTNGHLPTGTVTRAAQIATEMLRDDLATQQLYKQSTTPLQLLPVDLYTV